MSNLIIAGVGRLVKTRAYRITAVIVALIGLFQITMMYRDYQAGVGTPYFDSALFSIAAIGMIALAAAVSLFVESEYSDGTIRNKIAVGHNRVSIYISMLITSVIAGWLLVAVWTAVYLIPGVILMEHANPLWVYLCLYLAMFFELAVFSAIFTCLSVTLGNKAGSAVVCILLALMLMIQGIITVSLLEEPEYYSPEFTVSETGEVSYTGDLEPNPNYIPKGSPKRAFYNFIMDFTPGGQALQIAGHTIDNFSKICLYDIGWLVVLSGAGVLIFRRKDLK